MVTDSKEEFFEQVQLAPAVRDKVNSMIDSGLFFGNCYGVLWILASGVIWVFKGSLNYQKWKDLFLSD